MSIHRNGKKRDFLLEFSVLTNHLLCKFSCIICHALKFLRQI